MKVLDVAEHLQQQLFRLADPKRPAPQASLQVLDCGYPNGDVGQCLPLDIRFPSGAEMEIGAAEREAAERLQVRGALRCGQRGLKDGKRLAGGSVPVPALAQRPRDAEHPAGDGVERLAVLTGYIVDGPPRQG